MKPGQPGDDAQAARSLPERIAEQDEWTFDECLGLAAEFNVKVRFVIAMVFSQGRSYLDASAYQRRREP